MELRIHVLGAFDTLARPTVPRDALLAELQERGWTLSDSELAIDKALLERWLEPAPNGELLRPATTESGGERVRDKLQSSTPP
jgi:hypothetical protein